MSNQSGALPQDQQIAVNWRSPGGFTATERKLVEEWYSNHHGEGNLDGAPFVSFWLKHREPTFKAYRRWVESALQGDFPSSNVVGLCFLHSYTVLGWGNGAQYEVIMSHQGGVTKPQVIATLALAFLYAGPKGMSQVAPLCDDYLDRWKSEKSDNDFGRGWPKNWTVDTSAIHSGIDFSASGLSPDEIGKVKSWYLKNQGEVPRYVDFMAKWNPEGLKSLRARYEEAVTPLPLQVIPLLGFQTAAIQGRMNAMRRFAFQARHYGVSRSQIIAIMAVSNAYISELGLEEVADVMDPLLSNWPN